jgi:hypothetical protein
MLGDIYISRNVGAVGRNATAHNTTIIENHEARLAGVNLSALATQLNSLKRAMETADQDPSYFEAVATISAAEDSAKKNEQSRTVAKLRTAGSWAFEIATKIGVTVAPGAIKTVIGLHS